MKKAVFVLLISLFAASGASAKIDLSGTIRNDAIVLFSDSESLFVNLLENRLRFQRKTDAWKFDSDLKVDVITSDALAGELALPEGLELVTADLLRAYIKYFSPVGDVTVGKTYVNLGIAGVFNPFELDRNLDVSDLSATKSGLVAASLDVSLNDMTVSRVYVSPQASRGEVSGGGSISTHWGSFDAGLVMNHLGWDDNVVGVFIQGDLELGVQASWAYHLDDEGGNNYSEITAGLDYSFWEGKLLAAVQGYINGRGEEDPDSAAAVFSQSGMVGGQAEAFPGRYYLYANLTYAPDEFSQWGLYAFVHTQDSSSLVIPTWQMIVADGLTLSVQCMIPTGAGEAVYSRDAYGDAIALLRLEAKL